jgi:transposase, IS5 family
MSCATEREVRGNVGYRHFCRIGAERRVDPHPAPRSDATLDRDRHDAIEERAQLGAVDRLLQPHERRRVRHTAVEAPIRHPTDSRLLEDSIRVLGRHVRRIANAGVELLRPIRNTMRSVSRRAREIAQITKQRGDEVKEALKKPYPATFMQSRGGGPRDAANRGKPPNTRIRRIGADVCPAWTQSAVRAARPEWATYAQGARWVAKTSKRGPSGPRRG